MKDDARVGEVLDGYVRALRAGERPDRDALLARHPDLATVLEGLDFLEAAVRELPGGEEAGPGRTLGDYRLVREVGRGGMAVVYEAEQISLNRRVALKVLPFAAVLDPRQLQRFKNEALAAAQLHHPHIVPVHAVGCERGVHYFAMQYVEGQSLATTIRDMKGGGTGEGPKTPISSHASNHDSAYVRMAAVLGMQAAEGLDHAHQLGIVHRDVKPGNLLMDVGGRLWIVDFGLARLPSDAGLTTTGDVLGTVRYMSPEQALAKRAPIDHRTDVYSLGATLYELFTLEPAFPGDDPQRVMHEIATREPRLPRKANPALPADLETILLKAMEKEPARRYATAQEMADDLERFLDGKPVLARRRSLPTRAATWARRHGTLVASSFVVLLLATTALSVSASRIAREVKKTREALTQLRTEQGKTRDALDGAEANLRLALEAVDRFLIATGVRELQDERLLTQARRELLEQALKFYDTYLQGRKDRCALLNRGDILDKLQRYQEALDCFDHVLVEQPDDARALEGKGHMLWHLHRYGEALATLDQAERVAPRNPRVYGLRGYVYAAMKRYDLALAAVGRAVDIEPDKPWWHQARGTALYFADRPEEALAEFDRAIELDAHLCEVHAGRALALDGLGRYDDAMAAADRAVALDPGCAFAYSALSTVLLALGRTDAALEACHRAIALEPASATAHGDRGLVLLRLNRYQEALEEFNRAIALDSGLATAYANRACALRELGRAVDALADCDRAVALEPSAVNLFNQACVLHALGRYDEAAETLERATTVDASFARAHAARGEVLGLQKRRREAIEELERAFDLGYREPSFLNRLAWMLASSPESDRSAVEKTVAVAREAVTVASQDRSAWNTLGVALCHTGSWLDALEALEKSIDLGGGDAYDWFFVAIAQWHLGRRDDARTYYDKAVAWMDAARKDDEDLKRFRDEAKALLGVP